MLISYPTNQARLKISIRNIANYKLFFSYYKNKDYKWKTQKNNLKNNKM